MATMINMAVTDQAVIQPAELSGHFSDTLGPDGMFLNHDSLLCNCGHWFSLIECM